MYMQPDGADVHEHFEKTLDIQWLSELFLCQEREAETKTALEDGETRIPALKLMYAACFR